MKFSIHKIPKTSFHNIQSIQTSENLLIQDTILGLDLFALLTILSPIWIDQQRSAIVKYWDLCPTKMTKQKL